MARLYDGSALRLWRSPKSGIWKLHQGSTRVQALIELLAGFISLLIMAALSQFGVDIERAPRPQPEVHRVSDCNQPPAAHSIVERRHNEC